MPCFFFSKHVTLNSELTLLVTVVVGSVDLQLPLNQQQLHGGGYRNNGNAFFIYKEFLKTSLPL